MRFVERGLVDYLDCWQEMICFVDERNHDSDDQIWYVQHPPVYTLGRNGSEKNLLKAVDIPVIRTDRGGDITYHAPGQVILYVLVDLRRSGIRVKTLVSILEEAVIDFLGEQGMPAQRLSGAPGVYVKGKKVASLGLRVRNGCSYHGVAINVDMDTRPFTSIYPCGLENMQVTQLKQLGIHMAEREVAQNVAARIIQKYMV